MSSGFISEAEIAVAKQKRQEEWEKVRRPDEPIEYPEEPHDSRSLYERLKEQKDQKDLEFEESHKMKNMIRGLVEDEVEFLDVIDKATLNAKRKREQEENSEIQDYRKKVAELKEQTIDTKLSAELTTVKPQSKSTNLHNLQTSNRLNQKSILAGVIRKRKIDNTTPVTLATTTTIPSASSSRSSSDDGDKIKENDCSNEKIIKNDINQKGLKKTLNSLTNNNINNINNHNNNNNNITVNNNNQGYSNIKSNNSKHLYCIGILPSYVEIASDSSDSEQSTDIEDTVIDNSCDWLGRKKITVDANAVIEQHSNK